MDPVSVVDYHAAGESFRIVTSGVPEVVMDVPSCDAQSRETALL